MKINIEPLRTLAILMKFLFKENVLPTNCVQRRKYCPSKLPKMTEVWIARKREMAKKDIFHEDTYCWNHMDIGEIYLHCAQWRLNKYVKRENRALFHRKTLQAVRVAR